MFYSESEVVGYREQPACRGAGSGGRGLAGGPVAGRGSENAGLPGADGGVAVRFRNGACCLRATIVAWALVAGVGTAGAMGQDRPEGGGGPVPIGPAVVTPTTPAVAPVSAVEPPDPQTTIEAFNLLQSWILAAEVPEPPDAAAIPRAAGAAVVLRQGGEVVGRGVDISEDGLALWRAARAAWAEASGRVQVERDALMQTSLKEAAAGLTISLELSGAPVPMLGASYADMAAEIDPGLTGLAVRAGGRVKAMFPATMLATGTMPDEAFGMVLLDLFGGDQSKVMDDRLALLLPAVLRQRESVGFLKLKVAHLAQWEPGGGPVFLHRGGRLVEMGSMSVPELRRTADRMAQHLIGRAWPGADGYGMFGRLNPVTGKYDPRFADSAEQATAALAMRRYSVTRGMDGATARAANAFAMDLLAGLAKVEPDEQGPWTDPAASAACIVAYLENGRPGPDDDIRMAGLYAQCAPTVRDSFDAKSGFSARVAPGARGLVAWALVRMAKDSQEAEPRATATAAVRAVYAGTSPEMLVGQMPWLGWAEMELDGAGEIPASVALRDLRAMVWKHQLGLADLAPEDADFEGGVVFTKSSSPLPAWNTARPLAFMATMLGDSRLTGSEERMGEMVRVIGGLRFMRQLVVDEGTTFMFKGPARRTLGGVRAAPWDVRMPPDATSLGLLSVCEALRSISAISSAGGSAAGAESGVGEGR